MLVVDGVRVSVSRHSGRARSLMRKILSPDANEVA